MTTDSATERLIRQGLRDSGDVVPLHPDEVPIFPLFWQILVEPLLPKKRTGSGIHIPDEAQEVEKIQNTVGRVLRLGTLAFKAKAASGLDLSQDEKARTLQAGDYVLFARYTGQTVNLKTSGDDRVVILLSDSELLAVISDPDRIRFWI